MARPAYSGGGFHRGWGGGWGGGRHWGQAPGPTGNGWFDGVGTWFGGNTPQYAGAGQPIPGTAGDGSPVYRRPPPISTPGDVATTAPQAAMPVIVVPRT